MTLYEKLAAANKINGDKIILFSDEDRTIFVSKEVFETFFGDVLDSPTYKNLSGTHTYNWYGVQETKTAEELGYQIYFDEWKAQGIIN